MRAYLFCISNEVHSCSELGFKRLDMISYSKSRNMQIVGISSINSNHKFNLKNILKDITDVKPDTVLIDSFKLLSYNDRKVIQTVFKNSKISMNCLIN